jgi:hypothetical protein
MEAQSAQRRGRPAQRREIISRFFAILIDPSSTTIILRAETKYRRRTGGRFGGLDSYQHIQGDSGMKKLLLAVAIAVLVSDRASAVLIVNDNFDGYANQAAFQAVWTPIGTTAPTSAVLSTAQASSAPQSIQNPGTGTNAQYRNQLLFTETNTLSSAGNLGIGDKIIWSFDFYDSAPTASPQRNHSNLQDGTAPSATNQLIAMGFNNNQTGANSGGQFYMGRILGYTVPTTADPDGGPAESVGGAGAFFKLNDFGAGSRSLGWHNLKVEITTNDGLSTDYSFYVDNQLAERVSNVGTAASIRSYDVIRIGSGLSNGNTEAFYDNMRLEFVPVPEAGAFIAMSAVGLVSAGAVWIRKRRVGQSAA